MFIMETGVQCSVFKVVFLALLVAGSCWLHKINLEAFLSFLVLFLQRLDSCSRQFCLCDNILLPKGCVLGHSCRSQSIIAEKSQTREPETPTHTVPTVKSRQANACTRLVPVFLLPYIVQKHLSREWHHPWWAGSYFASSHSRQSFTDKLQRLLSQMLISCGMLTSQCNSIQQ